MGIGIQTVLNDYTFTTKYWDDYLVDNGVSYKDFQPWTLVSQSIAITAVAGAPSPRDVGSVTFFTGTPGAYTFTANDVDPSAGGTGTFPTSGITNGSTYNYIKVFNQGDFSYIPRLSPGADVAIDTSGTFPTDNNDPDNGIYPINQVTEFAPDNRSEVLITFTVTTVYNLGGSDITDTQDITQNCLQNLGNVGATLQAMLANSYYGHGIYGLDQWPVEEDSLYNTDGTSRAPAPRADVLVPDATSASGYAEYDQSTNGAGFQALLKANGNFLDTEIEAVPDIPIKEIDKTDFGFEIPGVDYRSVDNYFIDNQVPFPEDYV